MKFSDFITLQRGFDLPKTNIAPGEVPVVGSTSIIGYHNVAKVQGPGVCTGRSGSLGTVQFIDKPFWPHNTSLWVKDFKGNDPRFVYYCMQSLDFGRFNAGAGVPTLNRNHLDLLSVNVPNLPTQRKIAGILSAYDDLIENNLRRIKILEQMAQSLYREWFVRFRFPGHEAATFKDSEFGRIPEGWEVKEFREVFEIRYGKTLPKTHIAESGAYPVYGAGSVIGFYHKPICLEKCALVTSRGNGSGTVWRTREAAFITNNSLIILPKEHNRTWKFTFVELLLRSSNVMSAKTGSAQPQVTIENLNYVEAIVPLEELVVQFCNHVSPMYEAIDCLFKKNQTLRRTRDLLLPKLLSGGDHFMELETASSPT